MNRKEKIRKQIHFIDTFVGKVISDFSGHFKRQPITLKQEKKVETNIPSEEVRELAAHVRKIFQRGKEFLSSSDLVAIILHEEGYKTDLEPAQLARAVAEAIKVVGREIPLETQVAPGVGRKYRAVK